MENVIWATFDYLVVDFVIVGRVRGQLPHWVSVTADEMRRISGLLWKSTVRVFFRKIWILVLTVYCHGLYIVYAHLYGRY